MEFHGLIIGFSAFLIIGLLHPVVIKTEYYLGTKFWPAFLITGLVCLAASLFSTNTILSAILGVSGFSFLWSIMELFHQGKRVEKGWFPSNPNKKSKI